jgi:hypothetical protein
LAPVVPPTPPGGGGGTVNECVLGMARNYTCSDGSQTQQCTCRQTGQGTKWTCIAESAAIEQCRLQMAGGLLAVGGGTTVAENIAGIDFQTAVLVASLIGIVIYALMRRNKRR